MFLFANLVNEVLKTSFRSYAAWVPLVGSLWVARIRDHRFFTPHEESPLQRSLNVKTLLITHMRYPSPVSIYD